VAEFIYPHGTFGGDDHNSHSGGDANAGITECPLAGPKGGLYVEPSPVRDYFPNVSSGLG